MIWPFTPLSLIDDTASLIQIAGAIILISAILRKFSVFPSKENV